MTSATSIIGPLIMTNTFAWFTAASAPFQFAGAPFLLGAVLMLASTLLSYRALKEEKKADTGLKSE